jgi:probable rRNA maturation factor
MIGGAIMDGYTNNAMGISYDGRLLSAPKIDISIDWHVKHELSESWLNFVVNSALQEALPAGAAVQVSLLVADDLAVRELNREFRGLDEVTDVLSFSPFHGGQWEGDPSLPEPRSLPEVASAAETFVLPPEELPILGDIIISYPQAERQALDRSESITREIARLIIHGVLHLAGYDHMEPDEALRMRGKERTAYLVVFDT